VASAPLGKTIVTVDISAAPPPGSVATRSLASSGHGDLADTPFRLALTAAALLVLVLLGAIVVLLFKGGLPALLAFGLGFFVSADWNPVTENYGAAVMLYGTLVTSGVALAIAFPTSLGIALFLTEVAPVPLRRPIGTAIQLLAAVPSIIYGMWGFFVVVPLMSSVVQPLLTAIFGPIPLVGMLFSGAPAGTGILTAGLILALMIMPFITAMFVEIFTSVPPVLKEAAYGVGATTTEVFTAVTVPYGRTALVGAVMLGLGRALGETMAVTFVIGNANRIKASLYAPGASIASTIANEFPEAGPGSMKLHALLELGLALFVISFVVLALARWLVRTRIEG
jgi:phosphate transport system permease protein